MYETLILQLLVIHRAETVVSARHPENVNALKCLTDHNAIEWKAHAHRCQIRQHPKWIVMETIALCRALRAILFPMVLRKCKWFAKMTNGCQQIRSNRLNQNANVIFCAWVFLIFILKFNSSRLWIVSGLRRGTRVQRV